MVVVCFLVGLTYTYFEARREGENPDRVVDLSFWVFLFSILGSRALHVLVEWRSFVGHPLDAFKIWQGGLAYYGGFIAAILACLVFICYHRLPLSKWADLVTPVAMIDIGFGRIGCLLNGCCYGRPAPNLPWAITYPLGRLPLPLDGIPLHPAPIYESLVGFLLTGYLIWLQHRPHRPGQVVWTMVFGYAVARFVIEYFRADPRGGLTVLGAALSTSQLMAIPLGLASLLALAWIFRRPAPSQP
jgi:phosphatidylglycerol:prolipoprotein diacylglycerol transferase